MQPTLRDPNPPLTRSVEDYLKAIYHLSSQGGFAATSDIAAMLEVAPPSVSGMVKRLSETGLIEHVPYRGVQLTSQGRRAALRMIRRHRILELYLTQHLGYDWGSVHAEAERLEHAVSDELIERMASALGQPQYDPHGDPIPTAAGDIEEAELVALADARVGAKLELRQVGTQDAARLRYFAEQGLTPGGLLTVSDRQPFRGADSWVYTFTQEWPLFSRTHQLSFTVPIQRVQNGASFATGVGDVAVNYRYQLAAAERLSVAPRLSLLLPTGRARSDLGAGALGVQVNVPASVIVASKVVTHWNVGGTVTPSAKNAVGDQATTVAYNLGASVIWLARPTFNALLEVVWTRDEAVTSSGHTAASDALSISPGIRWAHNFSSGLQIVPGIAFPIGVGPSAGDDAVLFYLSFEHPFTSGSH